MNSKKKRQPAKLSDVQKDDKDINSGKFKCRDKDCRGKISFGNKLLLDIHVKSAHNKD